MLWSFTQDQLEAEALDAAKTHNLPYALVAAVCEQESSWNPWVTRYEPAFAKAYLGPLNLTPTEASERATSWGLMQIMGETAREKGFTGPLPMLCEPDIGIEWGCVYLAHLLAIHANDQVAALQAYNGGSNPDYASQVMARMGKYTITDNSDGVSQVAAEG